MRARQRLDGHAPRPRGALPRRGLAAARVPPGRLGAERRGTGARRQRWVGCLDAPRQPAQRAARRRGVQGLRAPLGAQGRLLDPERSGVLGAVLLPAAQDAAVARGRVPDRRQRRRLTGPTRPPPQNEEGARHPARPARDAGACGEGGARRGHAPGGARARRAAHRRAQRRLGADSEAGARALRRGGCTNRELPLWPSGGR
mmetsp:Transcript_14334/g.36614  ORF Transcript_14334/g.36614 Transcript_14334/m.36614 type:complete len:201 (+) Transcript_14334:1771-2373(+)